MATAAMNAEPDNGGEYKRPDMKSAIKIYKEEVAPKKEHIATIKDDLSDPHKRIKDECHCPRKVLDFLFQLEEMEDAKRDHWLLALREGMRELKLFMPSDLVTQADGTAGADVIPSGNRQRPNLATVGGDSFDEATPEELAAQEGRAGAETAEPQDAA